MNQCLQQVHSLISILAFMVRRLEYTGRQANVSTHIFLGNQRDHSNSHYDGMRSHSSHSSSSVQGYLTNQRYGGGGRQSEAEQMLQAKRRAAAQRERDLRNYHQEQQHNRSE